MSNKWSHKVSVIRKNAVSSDKLVCDSLQFISTISFDKTDFKHQIKNFKNIKKEKRKRK